MKKINLVRSLRFGRMISVVVLAVISVAASGQAGSVNFSGTWALNESKSTQTEGGFRMAPVQMVVTHNGVSLGIESTSSGPNGEFKSASSYTADGKECSNTFFGNNVRKSVLNWSADGKSLTFAHTMNFERDGETREFKTTENWKIRDEDKSLAVETVFNTPNGEMRRTNVYDRK